MVLVFSDVEEFKDFALCTLVFPADFSRFQFIGFNGISQRIQAHGTGIRYLGQRVKFNVESFIHIY
jgi:hypothetical protein